MKKKRKNLLFNIKKDFFLVFSTKKQKNPSKIDLFALFYIVKCCVGSLTTIFILFDMIFKEISTLVD